MTSSSWGGGLTAPLGDLTNAGWAPPSPAAAAAAPRGKRRSPEADDDPVSRFLHLLEASGCTGLRTELMEGGGGPSAPAAAQGGTSCTQAGTEALQVADPRQLRSALSAACSAPAGAAALAAGFQALMGHPALLRQLLLPIHVTRSQAYHTGGSLVRALLDTQPLQLRVASLLLQALPNYSAAECAAATSLPQLVLGQLRWLDVVADAAGLTATVLEVLPACPPLIQQQLIGFLPEVATPEQHELVVEQLLVLLEADLSFVAAVLDCLSNMQLDMQLQVHVLKQVLQLLGAVQVDDLPALLKYVVLGATAATAAAVVEKVRDLLHFVNPSDPRLPVPDLKQKGALHPRGPSAAASVVRELGVGLQQSSTTAGAFLEHLATFTTPVQHRSVDLVILLLLCRGSRQQQASAEALLKKKLQEEHAGSAWLTKAISGHQAMLADCWPVLLSQAEAWASCKVPALAAAAVHLYTLMFVEFEGGHRRQEVLQQLHGHLGSGISSKEDVALQALARLAQDHRELLSSYGTFLTNILDHLEAFNDAQLQQLFDMLVALTQPSAGARCAAGGGADGGAGSSRQQGAGRLEDELMITLTKAQNHTLTKYKRIGIVGGLALLWHGARGVAAAADGPQAEADEAQTAWAAHAEALFSSCRDAPSCLAFLLDQAANRVAAAGAAGPTAPSQQLPGPCLDWLADKVQDLVTNHLLADLNTDGLSQMTHSTAAAAAGAQPTIPLEDGAVAEAVTWFNCDGAAAPVYCRVGELALSRSAHTRAQLLWVAPALRCLAQLQLAASGELSGIDALLGCPVALPHPRYYLPRHAAAAAAAVGAAAAPGGWGALPASSKAGALLALHAAVGWWREVLNAFAAVVQAPAAAVGATRNETALTLAAEAHAKVVARCSHLASLEALLQQLAAGDGGAAAAAGLPDLARPLQAELLGAAAAASGHGGGAPSSKAGSAPDVLRLQRRLLLSAQQALTCCRPPHLRATLVRPAAYLLQELHAQLKALLSSRPAGWGGGSAAGPPRSTATGAPGADAGGVLQQLVPRLPFVVQHLHAAVALIRRPPKGDARLLVAELPGFADTWGLVSQSDAVQSCLHLHGACRAAALAALQVLTLLLANSGKASPGFLPELLAALACVAVPPAPTPPAAAAPAGVGGRAEAAAAAQARLLAPQAFAAVAGLSCLASGSSDLQLERAVLRACKELAAAAAAATAGAAAAPEALQQLRTQVAQSAAELLKQSWVAEDEAEEEGKGFSWKGRAGDIGELLQVMVSHSDAPCEVMLELVRGPLSAVPGKVGAKQQLDPVEGWASLCAATFLVWYRVLFQQLTSEWEALTTAALKLVGPTKAAKGKRGKAAAGAAAADQAAGDPWDEQQAAQLLPAFQHCAEAFHALVAMTRTHHQRTGVLNQALKFGGKFVEVFVRALPFWKAAYEAHHQHFFALVKEVQRGTKVLQCICGEGKARRAAGSLVNRAPATKRALEAFVFNVKAFTLEVGCSDIFWLGTLKHRDLAGHAVGSQMFPDELAEEEAEEDEEMADGSGGEEDEEEEEEE